jgi:hypothetical protein
MALIYNANVKGSFHNAKDKGSFHSARWRKDYNPELCIATLNAKNGVNKF